MKGITIHAPYAHLIAWGQKRYETRGWTTNHRGWIAIHAGKSTEVLGRIADEMEAYKLTKAVPNLFTLHFMDVLLKHPTIDHDNFRLNDLPRGAIVAVANLTGCYRGTDLLPQLSDREFHFGYFKEDKEKRFGWQLDDVFALPEPIPFKGQQGLFDVPENIVQQLRVQWAEAHKKGA